MPTLGASFDNELGMPAMSNLLTYGLVTLGVLLLAFLWRVLTSVQRGAGQRDQKILPLLDPMAAKLSRKDGRFEDVWMILQCG
ncbi:MAG: hypothetical protein RLZZ562_1688 [Planctomycetota bacterium]